MICWPFCRNTVYDLCKMHMHKGLRSPSVIFVFSALELVKNKSSTCNAFPSPTCKLRFFKDFVCHSTLSREFSSWLALPTTCYHGDRGSPGIDLLLAFSFDCSKWFHPQPPENTLSWRASSCPSYTTFRYLWTQSPVIFFAWPVLLHQSVSEGLCE